jgi:mRNA-degrading endonuclease RelE of RelBE toxin-antitoxin system
MRYEIEFRPSAVRDLKRLSADVHFALRRSWMNFATIWLVM